MTTTLTPAPPETIAGASSALRLQQRSCLDLLESCLARIDAWEPKVHAWVVVDRDEARRQAKALDDEIAAGRWRGPLHGITIGVKDIIDVAGFPTACGSPLGADGVASADAPIVARLRAAGAVIVGKTVTTPYAWIDPPPTRNPWNLDRTPGGSSSGSAAAVACGMVLGAIGSQTGGSITRPAAFCGVCGLKPTHGRLPVEGILPLAPSLDHPGPIARTVPDLQQLWDALAAPDAHDISAKADGAPIRLGLPRGFFADRIEPAMREAMARAVETLRRSGDVEVVEVDLPPAFTDVTRFHRLVMAAEAAAVHAERLAACPDAYPPRIRVLVEEGQGIAATDYARARQHQEGLKQSIQSCFASVDALITPAALGPAPDPTTTGDPLLNSPWSYTGLPTVSTPIGLSPEGLPLALQLVGPPFAEAELLRIGGRCEERLTLDREGRR